jgi:outer membrane protein OmpA-like peptidoglycan-associated protein
MILLVTAALALTITGCSTASKNIAPEPQPAPIAAPAPPPAPVMAPAPTYVIEDVNFDFDKSTLKPAATGILDKVAADLRQQSGVGYEVAGFTDSVGSEAYNQGLSERRAGAVRDYLVNHGVTAEQLTARGYGESSPLASNATAAGRAQNRRVEVRPLK